MYVRPHFIFLALPFLVGTHIIPQVYSANYIDICMHICVGTHMRRHLNPQVRKRSHAVLELGSGSSESNEGTINIVHYGLYWDNGKENGNYYFLFGFRVSLSAHAKTSM